MRLTLNSLLLVITITAPAFSYDLQPSKISTLVKDQVHELLSIASVECKRALAKSPTLSIDSWNCLPDHMNFATDYSNERWAAIIRGKIAQDDLAREVQYLLAGVRWPDDPIGTARSNNPIPLLAHSSQCKRWLKGDYGACGNRFCACHFGHLQMAHSMKPWTPWCNDSASTSSTCHFANREEKLAIADWVHWLVKIGKGDVGPSNKVFDDDSARMFFDRTCEKVYPLEFNYQSVFFVDCSKDQVKRFLQVWNWGKLKCRVIDSEDTSAQLKARAVGAILHLIQDSYARGHTLRVATSGSNWCSSRISCTKITKFSDFTKQGFLKHGGADKTPQWDPSCFKPDRAVDDPITAGAKVLRMFEDPSYTAKEIWEYLSARVFVETKTEPPTDLLRKKEKEAIEEDEKCFGKS